MPYSFILILKNVQIIKEQERLPAQEKPIKAKAARATKVQTVRAQAPKEPTLLPNKKKDNPHASRHSRHSNGTSHENTTLCLLPARSGGIHRKSKPLCKRKQKFLPFALGAGKHRQRELLPALHGSTLKGAQFIGEGASLQKCTIFICSKGALGEGTGLETSRSFCVASSQMGPFQRFVE